MDAVKQEWENDYAQRRILGGSHSCLGTVALLRAQGGSGVNEEMGALILNELTQMRRDSQVMLEKVVRIEETVRDVGDHEARLRVIEERMPDDAKARLTSLERWRYGLPVTGLVAVGSMALSAWANFKGAK